MQIIANKQQNSVTRTNANSKQQKGELNSNSKMKKFAESQQQQKFPYTTDIVKQINCRESKKVQICKKNQKRSLHLRNCSEIQQIKLSIKNRFKDFNKQKIKKNIMPQIKFNEDKHLNLFQNSNSNKSIRIPTKQQERSVSQIEQQQPFSVTFNNNKNTSNLLSTKKLNQKQQISFQQHYNQQKIIDFGLNCVTLQRGDFDIDQARQFRRDLQKHASNNKNHGRIQIHQNLSSIKQQIAHLFENSFEERKIGLITAKFQKIKRIAQKIATDRQNPQMTIEEKIQEIDRNIYQKKLRKCVSDPNLCTKQYKKLTPTANFKKSFIRQKLQKISQQIKFESLHLFQSKSKQNLQSNSSETKLDKQQQDYQMTIQSKICNTFSPILNNKDSILSSNDKYLSYKSERSPQSCSDCKIQLMEKFQNVQLKKNLWKNQRLNSPVTTSRSNSSKLSSDFMTSFLVSNKQTQYTTLQNSELQVKIKFDKLCSQKQLKTEIIFINKNYLDIEKMSILLFDHSNLNVLQSKTNIILQSKEKKQIKLIFSSQNLENRKISVQICYFVKNTKRNFTTKVQIPLIGVIFNFVNVKVNQFDKLFQSLPYSLQCGPIDIQMNQIRWNDQIRQRLPLLKIDKNKETYTFGLVVKYWNLPDNIYIKILCLIGGSLALCLKTKQKIQKEKEKALLSGIKELFLISQNIYIQ